jgi:Triosephosphate isomerase
LQILHLRKSKNVIVAYEPVWAIGTGKTATANEANDAIAYIRYVFGKIYGEEIAKELIILYGGSMNEKNANELLSMPHIGGGLIGGASLVAEKFNKIIEAY